MKTGTLSAGPFGERAFGNVRQQFPCGWIGNPSPFPESETGSSIGLMNISAGRDPCEDDDRPFPPHELLREPHSVTIHSERTGPWYKRNLAE